MVVATGGLTALIWLTQSLRFVELVFNRGLSFFVLIHLTSLLIPSFVAVILPITTYVVIQFVYQRMATDRELTVMRAAGLSPWALARPALVVALLATVVGYGLSIWGVPAATTDFKTFQWEIRNRLAAFLLQDGVFTPYLINSRSMSESRDQDGTLRGILVDDARDPTAHATILAERGRLLDSPNGPLVLLLDGSRQVIDHQSGRLDMLTFKQNELDLADATKEDAARPIDMSELPLSALLDPHPLFERDRAKWAAEGHRRLTEPLTTLSYALFGLFSSLGGSFQAARQHRPPTRYRWRYGRTAGVGPSIWHTRGTQREPSGPHVAARRRARHGLRVVVVRTLVPLVSDSPGRSLTR